jgi:RNA polymerase sigma-70 factor (ECF subfamily)
MIGQAMRQEGHFLPFSKPLKENKAVPEGPHSAVRKTVDLEKAVTLYYKDLYRFALSLCRHPQDAADLTQFAYERLSEKASQIEEPEKVKSWLQSTLYRKFIDQRRRSTRFPNVEFVEEHPDVERTAPDCAKRLDAQAALAALQELEEDLRAPLALFYLDGYSYKEIARTLDLPQGTVMSRLYRGKKHLFELLTQPKK